MRNKVKDILCRREAAFMQDGGGFIMFLLLFFVTLSFVFQINSIIRLTEDVRDQISKGATIAIKGALDDNYRRDYIAHIDTDLAEDIFAAYLVDNMHMTLQGNRYYQYRPDGAELFSFGNLQEIYDEGGNMAEPDKEPYIEVDLDLRVPFTIMRNILPDDFAFNVHLKIKAVNQRIIGAGDVR